MTEQTTTVEIAMRDYKELQSLQKGIAKILKKPISLKKTLSIVLSVKSLDQQLSELMLE
jgi:hypothetical protein